MAATRDELETWSTLSDIDWVKKHVSRFEEVLPLYAKYKEFLEAVLKEACNKLAPLAIVETRPKSRTSFAEKILRKRNRYIDPKDPLPPDPLVRMTDLCGGRVVVQASDQVSAVCRWIEQVFDIDQANSEDVSRRLQPREFGYRSVHYIVLINRDKLSAAGVTASAPDEILGLKAEIQVRTLLEHAWSALGHDMTYKTELKVPEQILRQFASVAAVLEGADREFGRLVHAFDDYQSNFGAYHQREEVQKELDLLDIVLNYDPENRNLALRSARQARAIGLHGKARAVLDRPEWTDVPDVQRALGITLVELHWDQTGSEGYRRGRALLERAYKREEKDVLALRAFADCLAHERQIAKATSVFAHALAIDPTEPITLCRFVELEIAATSNVATLGLVAPTLRNALSRARRQVDARVDLPLAWFALSVFHLLLDEPFPALSALAQVIALCDFPKATSDCEPSRPSAAGRALQQAGNTLESLRRIAINIKGFDWYERLLLVALASRNLDPDAREKLLGLASKQPPVTSARERVVILAGGCAPDAQPYIDKLSPALREACAGIGFALLSGGTSAGMSGLAGDLAENSGGIIHATGYLPRLVPGYAHRDNNPARFHLEESRGSDFTPLEPLQGWTDLIASGVDPRDVMLLSYAGGEIARAECAIALALGARVGLVQDDKLPKTRQFDEPHWIDHPRCLPLPLDPMTLRAFLLVGDAKMSEEDKVRLERAAKMAHEEYVQSATPKDPSLQQWAKLDEDLKLSNYHQVAYWEQVLHEEGLELRPLTEEDKKHPPLDMVESLGDKGVSRLAEKEHGRWNIERLSRGWRFAKEKDVVNRLSPYLVPWHHIPPKIQQYDIEPIRGLSAKFRQVGLEIVRSETKRR